MSNPTNFIGRTGLFLALTRAFQLLAVPLLLRWPITAGWMRDEFHHYQLGLLLIVPLLLCYRCGQRWLGWLLPLVLAWLLEEHLILIESLGGRIPWYYLSTQDSIVIFGLAVFCLLAALWLRLRVTAPKPIQP